MTLTLEQRRDPEIILPVRSKTAARWRRDPLLQGFDGWIRREEDGQEFIRTPRDALRLQRVHALMLVTAPTIDLGGISNPIEQLAWGAQVAGFIWNSPTIYWPRDILKLAFGLPLPKHVIASDVCPWESATFVFQRSWGMHRPGEDIGQWSVHTIHLRQEGDGLTVWHIGVGPSGEVGLIDRRLAFGSRYPDDCDGSDINVLAALAFVNSPFVRSERRPVGPMTKGARRRTGITKAAEPIVHVIRLRAEAEKSIEEVRRLDAGRAAPTHRWIVRGHYRAQWYPSSGAHRVIWIAPYLKGPEDAPFRQPVYAVVR